MYTALVFNYTIFNDPEEVLNAIFMKYYEISITL